jgi:hypothetical protein
MTTEKELSDAMEFDHPIRVHDDGSISDIENFYAPDMHDGEIESNTGWRLITGWSGQYSYSGPVMHNSEYIGGALAKHILSTPGIWVAVVCTWLAGECSCYADGYNSCETDVTDGWGLCFREYNE